MVIKNMVLMAYDKKVIYRTKPDFVKHEIDNVINTFIFENGTIEISTENERIKLNMKNLYSFGVY